MFTIRTGPNTVTEFANYEIYVLHENGLEKIG